MRPSHGTRPPERTGIFIGVHSFSTSRAVLESAGGPNTSGALAAQAKELYSPAMLLVLRAFSAMLLCY